MIDLIQAISPCVALLVGLPGAGKSSFVRDYLLKAFKGSADIVSKDMMHNQKHKAKRQNKLINKSLEQGRSIIIDNMNLSKKERAEIIDLAKMYAYPVLGFYFPLTPAQSLKRNSGPERVTVPPVAIFSAAKKLEIPTLEEGFFRLFEVHLKPTREFEIELNPEI